MSQPAAVRVSVHVAVEPMAAFEVFTAEVDAWYRRDRHTLHDHERTVAVRFEPGVGGRLIEVHDAATGEGREWGRVTAWEPGVRLVFVDDRGTEVEVTFEDAGGETRVTLEHRGLERLAPAAAERHARFGWRLLMPWFHEHVTRHERSATP